MFKKMKEGLSELNLIQKVALGGGLLGVAALGISAVNVTIATDAAQAISQTGDYQAAIDLMKAQYENSIMSVYTSISEFVGKPFGGSSDLVKHYVEESATNAGLEVPKEPDLFAHYDQIFEKLGISKDNPIDLEPIFQPVINEHIVGLGE